MAEKAKPTVLETLAAMKITIDTATQGGAWCMSSTRECRDQSKSQTTAPAALTSRPSLAMPTFRMAARDLTDLNSDAALAPVTSWPITCSWVVIALVLGCGQDARHLPARRELGCRRRGPRHPSVTEALFFLGGP